MSHLSLTLAQGMRLSRLSYAQLWTRCLALGGASTVEDLCRHVESDECPDNHEHNIIAQALNDTYLEQGRDHPVAYGQLHHPRGPH